MKLTINRTQSLQEALDATKRKKQYADKDILATAPTADGDKLEFFTLDKYVTDDELEKEYASRNLVPADIYSLVAYDLKNPKKMDKMKYVGTHWKDANGTWYYVAFCLWDGGVRDVGVFRRDRGWNDYWWFSGLKSTSSSNPQTSLTLEPLELRVQKLEVTVEKLTKIINI